jgi:rifampin ADP-ribosylating transferase
MGSRSLGTHRSPPTTRRNAYAQCRAARNAPLVDTALARDRAVRDGRGGDPRAAAEADATFRRYHGRVSISREPVPFEVYEQGVYLHGTKADLTVGERLSPGRESNFEAGRMMNYVYFTATLDAAVWGAELAAGEGRGHIYIVEPTGEIEDDPNLTDKKFPGNPTLSFRSREPLRVVGELVDWVGHSPEKLEAMRVALDALQRDGLAEIED